MRKCHQLKTNKKSEFPRHVVFFDVESEIIENGETIDHKPYLLCAKYVDRRTNRSQTMIYYDVKNFWHWLQLKIGKKEKYFVFAHNIAYDHVTSKGFEVLHKHGYRIANFYEEGRTFILKLVKDDADGKRHSTIEVLNVGNYYQGSVADIGKAVGLQKLDFNVLQNITKEAIKEAIPYCQRDVEIIEKGMNVWFDFCLEHDLGNFARTVPGQAFNAWRHRFLDYPVLIHNHQKAIEIERKAYFGGRVECFRVGEFSGDFHYLDVNGMYPFVMRDFLYPVKLLDYKENTTIDRLKKHITEGKLVVAEVTIKTKFNAFPVKLSKMIFPTGRYKAYLCTEELKLALRYDLVKKVHKLAVYEGQPIFKKYVEFFYGERLKTDSKVYNLLFKLLLNSLYGKMGQLAGGWGMVGNTELPEAGYQEIYDDDLKCYRSRRWIYGSLFEKQPEEEGQNSFPAIAAHVTANARMLLYKYMLKAGCNNIYYCDTDSLFTNFDGFVRLQSEINESELGKLKEEAYASRIAIFSPKDYIFGGDKIKHKGIKRSDEYLGNNTWRQIMWPKIGTLIRRNSLTRYFNIKRVKHLKRQYDKGYILPGGVVKPLRLNGDKINTSFCGVTNMDRIKEVWL